MDMMLKLGKDTSYDDYQEMLENHEIDDMIPAAQRVVDEFMQKFPTVSIDAVTLVVNKTAKIDKIDKIVFERSGEMPCFACEAFGDDEQCWKNLHWVGANGEVGSDCPRIRQATKRSE